MLKLVIGVDPHKQTHTAIAVRSGMGEFIGELTAAAREAGHCELLAWASSLAGDRVWALEDVRGVSRRLERDLLDAGERVVRVPPKLMAGARKGARSFGKSDSIDALAIARAALGHPDLPVALQDEPARETKLLVDHREALVRQRREAQDRLRWLLHSWDPTSRSRPPRWTARSGSTASRAASREPSRQSRFGSPAISSPAAGR